MARSRPWSSANAALRRRPQVPSPPLAEVEQHLWQWLSPASFQVPQGARNTKGNRMRQRLLTLPVMVAVVLSLVYRQINGLAELLRMLALEGMLWVPPLSVSAAGLDSHRPVALEYQENAKALH